MPPCCRVVLVLVFPVVILVFSAPIPVVLSWSSLLSSLCCAGPGPRSRSCPGLTHCHPGLPCPHHPCCVILVPVPILVVLTWSWSSLSLSSLSHCPVLVLVIPVALSWSSCHCLLLSPLWCLGCHPCCLSSHYPPCEQWLTAVVWVGHPCCLEPQLLLLLLPLLLLPQPSLWWSGWLMLMLMLLLLTCQISICVM